MLVIFDSSRRHSQRAWPAMQTLTVDAPSENVEKLIWSSLLSAGLAFEQALGEDGKKIGERKTEEFVFVRREPVRRLLLGANLAILNSVTVYLVL